MTVAGASAAPPDPPLPRVEQDVDGRERRDDQDAAGEKRPGVAEPGAQAGFGSRLGEGVVVGKKLGRGVLGVRRRLGRRARRRTGLAHRRLRMNVPVRPSRASASDSARVTRTSWPPASTKRIAASIFGPMLPGGNWPSARRRFAVSTSSSGSAACVALPKSFETRSTPGQDDEEVGREGRRQHRGRVILVDDGFDAANLAVVGDDDRNASAARGDDDVAAVDQGGRDLDAADFAGLRRGHDPAPSASGVLGNGPSGGPLHQLGLLLREKRADRLGGFQERRVRGVDLDLGHDRDDLLAKAGARQLVVEGELEQETHRAFRLGDAEVQRLRRDPVGGLFGLHQDVADLRPVAVDDDELVPLADDRQKHAHGLAGPIELRRRRAVVLRPQERVAAERHDRERPDEGEERRGVHERTADGEP